MKIIFTVLVTVFLSLALYMYSPETTPPEGIQADSVIVYKSRRKLVLLNRNDIIKEYLISLGSNPVDPKTEEGDGRTPEGHYVIDYRKLDSSFHRALHISYPNTQDKAAANSRGVSPGGLIMIHGIRNGLGFIDRLHRLVDWTNGCIAVTNDEIEEIERIVPNGTPIEIRS